MEEADNLVPAKVSTVARNPEALRQRQRERLSPRGRFARTEQIATVVEDSTRSKRTEIKLSPAPKTRPRMGVTQGKPGQAGWPKASGSKLREKGGQEGSKKDITPDGGSAGREGRQFTVANVGNNGKIYLR